MNYETCTRSQVIAALNILDSLNHIENWEVLQTAWEPHGGFVEFCGWIADIAEMSEEKLVKLDPDEFPGVYDYEVSHAVGQNILHFIAATKELPSRELLNSWLDIEMDSFFAQGGKIVMRQFEVFHLRDGSTVLTRFVPEFDRFWGFRRVVRNLTLEN